MKNIKDKLIIACLAIIIFGAIGLYIKKKYVGVDKTPLTRIEFESNSHDFGNTSQGKILTHTFRIKNVGTENLKIRTADASCGCTIPMYTKTDTKPNDYAEIVVKYNTKNKLGLQRESVSILANTNPRVTEFEISANVSP